MPPVRFEKLETLLRIALQMRGNAEGLSLSDIERDYDVSRRTAERMRDAIERAFPQMEQANPGVTPKRWRIRADMMPHIIGISAEELAALNTAVGLMRRDAMTEPAARLAMLSSKLKAMIRPEAARRIDPDLEILAEAEGIAMRPGPRQTVAPEIAATLRQAIVACRKIQLHYRARSTGALSRTLVCPYGFLYGNRPYLVADSLNPQAQGLRLFSLANIESVETTAQPFTRRQSFSLREFAERSFGVFQEEPFDVVWRFTRKAAADARHFLFHPTQKLEDAPDGSLIVSFRAGGALEMAWHLVTWGDQVTILKPKRLKASLRKQVQQLLRHHA